MKVSNEITKNLEGEYVCFVVYDQQYGVKTSQVRDIIEAPVIRRVPRSPVFVEGVANIRGRIIPFLNPVNRLKLKLMEGPNRKRGLIARLGNALYGILVDSVSSITYVSEEMIELVNPLMLDKEVKFIAGMAKHGDVLIYLLDFKEFVLAGTETDPTDKEVFDSFSAKISSLSERSQTTARRRFVSLTIGDENYGIDMSLLREVLPTGLMRQAPYGPEYLAGVVNINEMTLPVIDLQKKIGMETVPYGSNSRIAILYSGDYCYGLLANSVREVISLTIEEIKENPFSYYREEAAHIDGIGMVDGGKRLIVILNPSGALKGEELQNLNRMDEISMNRVTDRQASGGGKQGSSYVIFKVNEIELAIDLKEVREVIQFREPTKIPKAPTYVRGLISLKGDLVSVIDLRKRLGIEISESHVETRIIIVKQGEAFLGLLVDSVSGILRIAQSDILQPPEIMHQIDSSFIEGLIALDNSDRAPIILRIAAMAA